MTILASGLEPEAGLIHQALFYDSDEAFAAAMTPFCREGLERGDRVLAVTTRANVALLKDTLGRAATQVEFIEAADWYHAPGRTLAAYGRYVDTHKTGHPRVRIIGEPVWHGRSDVEEAEWTRYESVINAAFAAAPAWIVCPYDERTLPGRIVAHARRTHPELLSGAGPHVSEAYTAPAAFTYPGDELPLPPPPSFPGSVMEVEFDADLRALRHRLAEGACALGMSSEQTQRLILAVGELATNTLQHADGRGRVRMWADGDGVICDVIDLGQMTAPFPGYLAPAPDASSGHGLWVVRQLCTLMQIRTQMPGTQIRLHLART
ncbi:anti-sigma factor RsbA family regulatory protein [Sphaerisporangium fuscum]|uniref:anti-sigma factor RsbA family regulatory protein n=1 Tax=Sphaerisporangium fuscum TaxID=2835868 RepID=UPI001BDD66CD|nr:anti-sigma factor RsbA family regulatory protein [Sphaerisporangium fuscum]